MSITSMHRPRIETDYTITECQVFCLMGRRSTPAKVPPVSLCTSGHGGCLPGSATQHEKNLRCYSRCQNQKQPFTAWAAPKQSTPAHPPRTGRASTNSCQRGPWCPAQESLRPHAGARGAPAPSRPQTRSGHYHHHCRHGARAPRGSVAMKLTTAQSQEPRRPTPGQAWPPRQPP
jgi:hypothetical protein